MPETPATEWYEKMVVQGTMPEGMVCWEVPTKEKEKTDRHAATHHLAGCIIKAAAMKSPIQEMQNIVAFACTEQLSSGSESLRYNIISFPVVFLLDRNLLDYCMYLPKVPRDIFALLLF